MNRDFAYQIEKKACKYCSEVKPLYEYYRSKTTADGFFSGCIKCIKARRKPSETEILRKNLPSNHTRWRSTN